MSNAVFPDLPGLKIEVDKTPAFRTGIRRAPHGREKRTSYRPLPVWTYRLGYEFLRAGAEAELQALMGFFLARRGAWDSFLFRDPDDNVASGEPFGTGDGVTAAFQLIRDLGGFVEPVRDLDGAPTLYATDWQGTHLLYTMARANLLTYTERFYGNALWAKTNASAIFNAIRSPYSGASADKLVENNSASSQHLLQQNVNVTSGTVYTFSVWVKAAERGFISLQLGGAGFGSAQKCFYDLTTGATNITGGAPTVSAIAYPNGWWRLTITATATITATTGFLIYLATSLSVASYTGDGTSGIYLWGAQLEIGNAPTSYMPSADAFVSRASSGTYINASGLIASAASNVARLSCNPLDLTAPAKLLLEAAATNLFKQSEDITTSWTPVNVTRLANQAVAPDGNTTADFLGDDTTPTVGRNIAQTVSFTSGTTYTFSCFAKEPAFGSKRYFSLVVTAASFGATIGVAFDIAAGTVTTTAGTVVASGVQNYGNGWKRCWFAATATATASSAPQVCANNIGSNVAPSWTGDGVSGLYVWGMQAEAGAFPTSYIATTTATVPRSADVSTSTAATPPADYTLDAQGLATFSAPPAAGLPLTWSGSYFKRLHFARDESEFDQFLADLWSAKKVELESEV